ncbi:MAG: PAS domain S-box protein, partial [Acidobacteria bacterium]|nr:PAS domain S-box protein [Acidobacteriota bacterium]
DLGLRFTTPERRSIVEKLFHGEQLLEPSREAEWIRKDGAAITVEIHDVPVYDEAGALVAIEGIAREITQRRRSEEWVRKLSQVAEQIPVAVVITDTAGTIEYVNSAFTAISGYTHDEALGKNPRILKSGEMRPEEYRHLWSSITAGREWAGVFHNKAKDGRLYWERAVIAPIVDARGSITNFVGIKEDITEQKKLEEQFRQSQKMEAVGRLAGGVAHDFNNLLTVINGYSNLLLTRLPESDPSREMASQIYNAGERAADLTQQLLAFSRRQPAQPQPLNINKTIEQTRTMLERLLGEDIRLVMRLDPGVCLVMADSGQIHQIVMNLAVNARDAMPGGGTLTIETATVEVDQGLASLHSDAVPGSYVMLAVSDTGVGMDAEMLEHIFEPFYTTKAAGKGTGLGLSMVYGVVRQYGGWIGVYSEPGRGSTFKIHLPRLRDDTAQDCTTGPEPAAMKGSETILVVEDQPDVRKFAAAVLRGCGYRVLEAARGEDALLVAAGHPGPIQLMLTDAVMPGMSGMELARRFESSRPDMTVVFMSGYGENVIAQGGMISPDVNYLSKPFSADALVQRVRDALDS